MKNYIKWEAKNSEPCLIVDVNLRVTLEVKKETKKCIYGLNVELFIIDLKRKHKVQLKLILVTCALC